jgi:predicted kinase
MPAIVKLASIPGLAPRPLYVLVAGGIAVGKSHVIREAKLGFPIMDVDDVMDEIGSADYEGRAFRDAIEIIGGRIETIISERRSLVAMGTCSDLAFTIDRLHGARMKGYATVLVHVTAPLDQALAQNEERRVKGRRTVALQWSGKIAATAEASAKVVDVVSETTLVDFLARIDNRRRR